jgi:hypothetical protein
MVYYLQVNQNSIITDAVSYPVEGYVEHETATNLPAGINGGWWKLENGLLVEYPELKPKTESEVVAELKENQLILMDVLATMYEDMLTKGTV